MRAREFVAPLDAAGLTLLVGIGVALSNIHVESVTLLLLLVAGVVAVAAPVGAVAAIGTGIPFIYHPIAVHGGSWSLLELGICVAAGSVGLRVLLDVCRARSLVPVIGLLRPWPLTLGAAALLEAGAFSLTHLADVRYRADSLRELRWVLLEPTVAFLLFRWALRRGGRTLILAAFLGMGLLVAVAGGIDLVRGNGVVIADGVERATGPYPHPNNLALYLDRIAAALLALTVALPRYRRAFAPIAIVSGLGLASTFSRGAAIAYVGSAAFVLLVTRSRRGWRWLAGGVVAAVVVLLAIGAQRLTDRGASGATSSRRLIWTAAIRMIRDHPLTGIGPDQFLYQYNRRYVAPSGWPERYTSHPHNLVLDLWLSLGVPGLVVAAGLVLVVVWRFWRIPQHGPDRAVWLATAAALVGGLIHGLVDNGYFLPDLALMTWMLLALLESTRPKISVTQVTPEALE